MPDEQNTSVLIHFADNFRPLPVERYREDPARTHFGDIAKMVQPTGMLGEGTTIQSIRQEEHWR